MNTHTHTPPAVLSVAGAKQIPHKFPFGARTETTYKKCIHVPHEEEMFEPRYKKHISVKVQQLINKWIDKK